jgi:hypothetical protein
MVPENCQRNAYVKTGFSGIFGIPEPGILFDLSLLTPVFIEKRHPKGAINVFQSAPKCPIYSESLANQDLKKSVPEFGVFCSKFPPDAKKMRVPGTERARIAGRAIRPL